MSLEKKNDIPRFLLVSCIDTNVHSPLGPTNPHQLGASIDLFLEIQTLLVPLLARSEPSGLLLVSSTLSPTLSAGREFLEVSFRNLTSVVRILHIIVYQ